MAGYYDPYTEEYIETEDQATLDFYDNYDYDNAVGYDDPYFNGYEYDDGYYGYGDDDWAVANLPDYEEVG